MIFKVHPYGLFTLAKTVARKNFNVLIDFFKVKGPRSDRLQLCAEPESRALYYDTNFLAWLKTLTQHFHTFTPFLGGQAFYIIDGTVPEIGISLLSATNPWRTHGFHLSIESKQN